MPLPELAALTNSRPRKQEHARSTFTIPRGEKREREEVVVKQEPVEVQDPMTGVPVVIKQELDERAEALGGMEVPDFLQGGFDDRKKHKKHKKHKKKHKDVKLEQEDSRSRGAGGSSSGSGPASPEGAGGADMMGF